MDESVCSVCEGGVDHLVAECPAVPRVEGSESRVGRSKSTVEIAIVVEVAADGQIVVSVVDDGFELVEMFFGRSGTLEELFPERLGCHEDCCRLIEVLPGGSSSEAACLAQVAFGGPHGSLRLVGVGFRLAELFGEWSMSCRRTRQLPSRMGDRRRACGSFGVPLLDGDVESLGFVDGFGADCRKPTGDRATGRDAWLRLLLILKEVAALDGGGEVGAVVGDDVGESLERMFVVVGDGEDEVRVFGLVWLRRRGLGWWWRR
jgi:hypothetical protein